MTTIDVTPGARARGSYDGPATFSVGFERTDDPQRGVGYGDSPLADLGSVLSDYFGRRIGFVGDPWSQLAEGFLVRTHVYGPDCHAALTPTDFGLDASSYGDVARYMKVGSIDLMEESVRSKLDSIHTRWRRLVKKHGVRLHWGEFVPLSAWDNLEADAAELRREHEAVLDDWIDFYASYKDNAEIRARILAEQAYSTAKQLGNKILTREDWNDMSAFVNKAAARMMEDYPQRDKLKSLYRLAFDQDMLPMPSLAEAQASWTLQVQQDKEARIAEAQAALKVNQAIKEAEYMEAFNRLTTEQAKARRKAELVEAYAEKTRKELDKRKREMLSTFYAGFALQLRMRLYESLALVIEGAKKGKFTPQATNSLRLMVGELEALRLDSDEEMDQMLATCKRLMGEPRNFSPKAVSDQIEDLGRVLQLSILSLGGEPRAKRDLKGSVDVLADLPEDPVMFRDEIRRRRAGLGMNETLGEVIMVEQQLTPTDLRRRRNRMAAAID